MTKLKVARSLPNDQNGLLDHLALNSSKSSLCQLQLCIKVVIFQKQKIWDAKSQCTHLAVVSACCKAHHASYKHNLDAGGKAAQTDPGRKSSIAKIYGIIMVFWRISDCWCMLMRYRTELLIFHRFLYCLLRAAKLSCKNFRLSKNDYYSLCFWIFLVVIALDQMQNCCISIGFTWILHRTQ